MRRILHFGVLIVICLGARPVSAQWVVQDPANLVQNTLSAVREGQSLIRQVRELRTTIRILRHLQRDLQQLDPHHIEDLGETFRRLRDIYHRGKQLSMRWQRVAGEFNRLYEKYDPTSENKQTYRQKRKRWRQQTDRAVRSAMVSHGVVSEYENRDDTLQNLVDASDRADGTLAAIQAGNRISALLLRQLQELTEIIVADSRARLSHVQERRRMEQASEADRKQNILEGYDTPESYEKPPSSLPRVK